MAALFESMPNLNEYVRNTVNNVKSATVSNRSLILMYALAALFIALVIMMLMGKKINWSSVDPRPKSWSVYDGAYSFWKPGPNFVNLTVPKNTIANFKNDGYSASFDCVLYNSRVFTTTNGPWRHIVHRGSNELAQTTVGGAVASCGVPTASNIHTRLPPFGLPRRMNPGIFLDPNTNDIIIFVDTVQGSDYYRESVRIADIPLDIPFRLGVVLSGRVLEVYINCGLEVTKVLNGDPKAVEDVWYGLAGSAAAQAQIQNLYIWDTSLNADDMSNVCAAPINFATTRPICNVADTVISSATASASAVAKTVSDGAAGALGYGNALNACTS
jgi:hypothetical protein